MNNVLEQVATVFGVLGLGIAAVAGGGRLLGLHHIMGFESMTLLVGAIALMAASCVIQLHLLRLRQTG